VGRDDCFRRGGEIWSRSQRLSTARREDARMESRWVETGAGDGDSFMPDPQAHRAPPGPLGPVPCGMDRACCTRACKSQHLRTWAQGAPRAIFSLYPRYAPPTDAHPWALAARLPASSCCCHAAMLPRCAAEARSTPGNLPTDGSPGARRPFARRPSPADRRLWPWGTGGRHGRISRSTTRSLCW
jgi:hypothetical protein